MTSAAGQMPSAGAVYRFTATVAFGIFDLQRWRFDVEGLEHLPPTGGAVLAMNHTSFWDFFSAGRPVWEQLGRPVRILAKESLFRAPVFGWMMRRSGHIPVHRAAGTDALRSALAALRRGEVVLVLPEQTISPSFDLLPLKTGAARMAAEAGVPLIPTISWGTQRFHTIGRRPAPCWQLPVSITYGEPLRPDAGSDPEDVTAELRHRLAATLDRTIDRYPDRDLAPGAWWHPARLGGGAPEHERAIAEVEQLRRQWRRQ